MDTCCGYERTASFCCQCGRELQHDPAYELLQHITEGAARYETVALIAETDRADDSRTKRNTANKWHRWRSFLQTVIAASEDKPWPKTNPIPAEDTAPAVPAVPK